MSLDELTQEQADLEWQMYVLWCYDRKLPPRPDEFAVWLEDR